MALRSSKNDIAALHQTRQRLQLGGGEERIAKQHNEGKLTARERIQMLVDRGTFHQHLDAFAGGELALVVLLGDAFFAASKLEALPGLVERGNIVFRAAEGHGVK